MPRVERLGTRRGRSWVHWVCRPTPIRKRLTCKGKSTQLSSHIANALSICAMTPCPSTKLCHVNHAPTAETSNADSTGAQRRRDPVARRPIRSITPSFPTVRRIPMPISVPPRPRLKKVRIINPSHSAWKWAATSRMVNPAGHGTMPPLNPSVSKSRNRTSPDSPQPSGT